MPSSDPSDLDSWQELDNVATKVSQYGLRTDLYDTISMHLAVDSGHILLEHFLDNLEMEFVRIINGLQKKDTCIIPKCNRKLATSLRLLSKDPDWSLVQLN